MYLNPITHHAVQANREGRLSFAQRFLLLFSILGRLIGILFMAALGFFCFTELVKNITELLNQIPNYSITNLLLCIGEAFWAFICAWSVIGLLKTIFDIIIDILLGKVLLVKGNVKTRVKEHRGGKSYHCKIDGQEEFEISHRVYNEFGAGGWRQIYFAPRSKIMVSFEYYGQH
ncbi:MAG: hypothetical protein M3033_06720 [Acidobacteriota bacterium]|nr:hypothetical protein [Acidobacteriota bacterium]